jgi:hypothetical protein
VARRIFFSFHYQLDHWRVQQVRQSWRFRPGNESQPFYDHADWEKVKRGGDAAIQRFIDGNLKGSSATVILAGSETAGRRWVNYEIEKSYAEGKGLLVVRIHKLKNQNQQQSLAGRNPLDDWTVQRAGQKVALSSVFKTYDWVSDDGNRNLADWVENAIRIRNSI